MFVRHIKSIPVPRSAGLIIALNTTHKCYFLLSSSTIDRIISKMSKSIGKGFDFDPRLHVKFRELAWNSTPDEWEFYYSTDATAPVPQEISALYKLVLTGTGSDACINHSDRVIYKVSHNFTDIAIYVVDKSTATKQAIARKSVTQLGKYLTQHNAEFSKWVCPLRQRIEDAHRIMISTLNRTAYDMRDIYIERVERVATFITPGSQCRHMNLHALKEQAIACFEMS